MIKKIEEENKSEFFTSINNNFRHHASEKKVIKQNEFNDKDVKND